MKVLSTTTEGLFGDLPSMEPPQITERTIYHVGVSGGKDSAAALLWLVRESGIDPTRIRASFCEITNDHAWTLEHVKMLSETVHPIEVIYPEINFFDLALAKKRFPSVKARFCTEHLKIYPSAFHLLRMRYAGFDPIAVSGGRADESDARAGLPEWDYSGTLLCVLWRSLVTWTLADVLAIHQRHGIPLNPLYGIGAERVADGRASCRARRKSVPLLSGSRSGSMRFALLNCYRNPATVSFRLSLDQAPFQTASVLGKRGRRKSNAWYQ